MAAGCEGMASACLKSESDAPASGTLDTCACHFTACYIRVSNQKGNTKGPT